MFTYFKNQLRGYNVLLAVLQAFSKDICRNCIGLEGAKTKAIKGLKKLRKDLENSNLPDIERKEIFVSIERFSEIAENIDVTEEISCQKTAGNCKIGPGCLPLDGAMALMKQITEPELITASKVVDVRQACCYDTLTGPIKSEVVEMKQDEILEVIITPGFRDMFNMFVEREKYQILEKVEKKDEILLKIRCHLSS